MQIPGLDEIETLAVEWQYGMMGGFYSALMDCFTRADQAHQRRLGMGFPDHWLMYQRFHTESGWWQRVEKHYLDWQGGKNGQA